MEAFPSIDSHQHGSDANGYPSLGSMQDDDYGYGDICQPMVVSDHEDEDYDRSCLRDAADDDGFPTLPGRSLIRGGVEQSSLQDEAALIDDTDMMGMPSYKPALKGAAPLGQLYCTSAARFSASERPVSLERKIHATEIHGHVVIHASLLDRASGPYGLDSMPATASLVFMVLTSLVGHDLFTGLSAFLKTPWNKQEHGSLPVVLASDLIGNGDGMDAILSTIFMCLPRAGKAVAACLSPEHLLVYRRDGSCNFLSFSNCLGPDREIALTIVSTSNLVSMCEYIHAKSAFPGKWVARLYAMPKEEEVGVAVVVSKGVSSANKADDLAVSMATYDIGALAIHVIKPVPAHLLVSKDKEEEDDDDDDDEDEEGVTAAKTPVVVVVAATSQSKGALPTVAATTAKQSLPVRRERDADEAGGEQMSESEGSEEKKARTSVEVKDRATSATKLPPAAPTADGTVKLAAAAPTTTRKAAAVAAATTTKPVAKTATTKATTRGAAAAKTEDAKK